MEKYNLRTIEAEEQGHASIKGVGSVKRSTDNQITTHKVTRLGGISLHYVVYQLEEPLILKVT